LRSHHPKIGAGTILPALSRLVLAGVAALALGAAASAQQLFKYRDANGVWVYTDRPPDSAQDYETREIERRFEPAEVRLQRRRTEGGIALVAINRFFAPVEIAFRLTSTDNVADGVARRGVALVDPRDEATLLELLPRDLAAPLGFTTELQYLPGDPGAQHRPAGPYRLPFAQSTAFVVTQAFPDVSSHTDPSSQYAVDFSMPIGTPIYAARAGTIVEVASDFFESGLDPVVDGPRANLVRVLHDDGTMSLYAHLSWNSIRVVPGETVVRGQYLADSGNTGFSTGPHLHFVVQRNRGGALVSMPVEFAGAGGVPVALRVGERATAY
jgi:murein DD-endopeptidase MepM/ murein hydrolase activator NlpD